MRAIVAMFANAMVVAAPQPVSAQEKPKAASDQSASMPADRALAARIAELEARLRAVEESQKREADSLKRLSSPPGVTAGAQGFSVRSADNQFQMRFRGYIQSDGRFFVNDVQRPATGTFLMRRVRPVFEGTIYKFLDFRLMPDFGGSSPALFDAHVDIKPFPWLNLRSGKFKPPIGLERLQSAADIAFVERAHPTSLAPSRDVGVQFYGDIRTGVVSYAAGVFNGVPDLASGDGDNGNNKDLVGRIMLQPFKNGKIIALRELALGIAGSRGVQRGSVASPFLPAYRSPAQQSVFAYRSDATPAGTVFADGLHTRIAPQGYYYAGPFGFMGEYTRSSQSVRRATTLTRLDHQAWQATASVLLTGDAASFRGTTPRKQFDPTKNQWGAVELAGRYTRLLLDNDAFPTFANPATQIRDAKTWGAGINWYLSRGVRLMVDLNETSYSGGATSGNRERERTILTRLQNSF